MTKMDVATRFFHACEGLEGGAGCAAYVADGATFEAQSEPIAEIRTVLDYCDWMQAVGKGPLAGCHYDLVASSFDEEKNTALFYGVFYATHNGEGGPVEPTSKSTASHYVYVITLNEDNKVSHMVKVWNAPWALGELGWV